jgi:uncharacterized protein (UPF0335 family)
MGFFRDVSPKRAVSELRDEWQSENPHRWRVLAVSVGLTISIFIFAIPESQRIEPRPPEVTWITTYAEGRTDEEIMASNLANQEYQDRLRALEEERAELRKEIYRELGRASGFDVDEMERKIEEDRVVEEVAEQAQEGQAGTGSAQGAD